jgi:DNA replication licensing factor MCM4
MNITSDVDVDGNIEEILPSNSSTPFNNLIDSPQSVIWGTNLKVNDIYIKIYEYYTIFGDEENEKDEIEEKDEKDKKNKFIIKLQKLSLFEKSVDIDLNRIFSFSKALYSNLINYPSDILPIFDSVVNELFNKLKTKLNEVTWITRPMNLLKTVQTRELGPSFIDKLISVSGLITRTSDIIPDLNSGVFRCCVCQNEHKSFVIRGKIDEPKKCIKCGNDNSMIIIHNLSDFTNKQIVKVQETPENIPEGETPQTISVIVYENLVDFVKPGDRVIVTGILRAIPIRINPNQRKIRNLFKTYLDAVHFQKLGVKIESEEIIEPSQIYKKKKNLEKKIDVKMEIDEENEEEKEIEKEIEEENEDEINKIKINNKVIKISEKEEKKFIEMSKREDIYEVLANSIAPNIYKLDDVKKGILCQLFGGSSKTLNDNNMNIRGEINILLCGDPGVSKSQILTQVHKIAPRGIYTSGKNSSAVGLTAHVTKDFETDEYVLEGGALVLSNNGICCIDEFDKMSDSTRSVLHEVMEQQTVSVAKAGIVSSLSAKTSILAAANPKESIYNEKLSVVENIQLPPTLLSRFDLIFLIRDKPDDKNDEEMANHLISLYYQKPEFPKSIIDVEILTKYIEYARTKIHPEISDEASKKLVDSYVQLRKFGSDRKQITATTRQLESLIRISEALAKIRLSTIVEEKDVDEAVRLVKNSIYKIALDHKTGTVDIDVLFTGLNLIFF